jgi:hypothetical protein
VQLGIPLATIAHWKQQNQLPFTIDQSNCRLYRKVMPVYREFIKIQSGKIPSRLKG